MGGGCLQSSASKCKRGNYEKMCPMSRKTRIRRPLPYFLERTLVGTHLLLFGFARTFVRRERTIRYCRMRGRGETIMSTKGISDAPRASGTLMG